MIEGNVVALYHRDPDFKWVLADTHEYENEEKAKQFLAFHMRQINHNPFVKTIHHADDTMLEWTNDSGHRVRVTNCYSCKQRSGGGPDHAASERCRSGKRPHCTCDTCF